MRCKACDKRIDRTKYIDIEGESSPYIEDLCGECLDETFSQECYVDREEMFENLPEGPVPPKFDKY